MAVYIDDMYKSPIGEFQGMKMSHMIADSTEELVAMAKLIGVSPRHIQDAGTVHEHFDVCMSKRAIAIKNGATAISWRELGERILARAEGKPYQPKQPTLFS